eukprot:TRINITY_DN9483_c0_g2_i1.p1 TRINITY_DN9483_c0_g2~~TRINITY_DN9483_c0_g2_i1.p1  ORF type:complete len:367 (+),score=74.86 TRINITY_DN9483_c0_g2_i1:62-1102(+)
MPSTRAAAVLVHVAAAAGATLLEQAEEPTKFERNPKAVWAEITEPVQMSLWIHDPESCIISRDIVRYAAYDAGAARLCIDVLNAYPDRYFVDIGANLGAYSLPIAKAGHKTLSLEPMRYNFELLAASRRRNGLRSNMKIVRTAVGEKTLPGEVCITNTNPRTNTGNGMLLPEFRCVDQRSEKVRVQTLDAVLASEGIGSVCFAAAKLDVEGYELSALQGAQSALLGSCKPCLVLIEYWATQIKAGKVKNRRLGDIWEILIGQHGYHCVALYVTDGRPRPGSPVLATMAGAMRAVDGEYACWQHAEQRCDKVVQSGFERARQAHVRKVAKRLEREAPLKVKTSLVRP